MRHTQYKHDKGIAIIEVLIAMLILGFGLVGVSQMQGKVVKQNTLAKQRVDAINIAEGTIEDLKNIVMLSQYEGLSSGSPTAGTYDADPNTNHYAADYSVYWTVNEDASKSFKTVNVRVQWPDMSNSGNPSQYTTFDISTVISKRRLPLALDMASSTILPNTVTAPPILKPLVCECKKSNDTAVSGSSWGGMMMKNDHAVQADHFIKVMGMKRWSGSSSTTTSDNDGLCGTCCNMAVTASNTDYKEPQLMYAKSEDSADWAQFQSSRLIKPSLKNVEKLMEHFQKTMCMHNCGGSSTTYNAACGVDVSVATPFCAHRMM